jgi:hypothetical protein
VIKPIPARYWAPMASIWLALAALAAISGNLYLAAVAVASLGLLALSLRLEALQRQRHATLATAVSLIDAKVAARLRESRRE